LKSASAVRPTIIVGMTERSQLLWIPIVAYRTEPEVYIESLGLGVDVDVDLLQGVVIEDGSKLRRCRK